MEKSEAEKVELALGLNAFGDPLETSGATAWANMITKLLFMVPGTMPSDPEMGCDISQYEFSFVDEVKAEIEQNITDQVNTYYPDIPMASIDISTDTLPTGRLVLLIQIVFTYDGMTEVAVVAAEKVNSIIRFEVAV